VVLRVGYAQDVAQAGSARAIVFRTPPREATAKRLGYGSSKRPKQPLFAVFFADYAGGLSPRKIARNLNVANIPGPRGGRWTASLLLGNAQRETGILRNRLYAGELVWNRQCFIKDPHTGKRVARPNPRTAWIFNPVPTLRIVEPELWNAGSKKGFGQHGAS
jgi:hypothetical protein